MPGPGLFRSGLLLQGDLVDFKAKQAAMQAELDQGEGPAFQAVGGIRTIACLWSRLYLVLLLFTEHSNLQVKHQGAFANQAGI